MAPILLLCALRIFQGVRTNLFTDLGPCFLSCQDTLMAVLVLSLGCVLGTWLSGSQLIFTRPFVFLKTTVGVLPLGIPLLSNLQSTEVSQLQGYGLAKVSTLGSSTVLTSLFVVKLTFLLSFVWLLL